MLLKDFRELQLSFELIYFPFVKEQIIAEVLGVKFWAPLKFNDLMSFLFILKLSIIVQMSFAVYLLSPFEGSLVK